MSDDADAMTLHFIGIESENGTLPAEYLMDIGRFGKALKALSKELYIFKSGKKRAPSGFKGIDFNMSGLASGSTVVTFKPVNLGPSDITTANETYDIIVKHLSGTGIDMSDYHGLENYDPTENVETNCRGLWNDLGDGVSLEFARGTNKYRFSKDIRGTVRRRTVSEITVVGNVFEMDCRSKRFKLQFVDDNGQERTASVLFGDIGEQMIMSALKDRASTKVRVSGKCMMDGSVVKDIEPSIFKLLTENDATARLEELIRIASEESENDGELSDYITRLRILEGMISSNYSCDKSPYIYPTPDNNLEFEWQNNNYLLTLDIHTLSGELITDDDEIQLNLNEPESWKRLCELIGDGTES